MRFVAGRDLQRRHLDLGEVLAREEPPARRKHARAYLQQKAGGLRGHAGPTRARPLVTPCAKPRPPSCLVRMRRFAEPRSPRPAIGRKISREGHRQFDSQGQHHRAGRRPALRRAHRRKLPSRQGHPDDADRHAPPLRRREDHRSLQDDRAGRARLCRGSRLHLPVPGRRRLHLHEHRDLTIR